MRRAALALAVAAVLGGAGGARLTGEPSRGSPPARGAVTGPPYGVGETQLTFVDRSRTVAFPGQPPHQRRVVTIVRYPIAGSSSRMDVRNAPPDRTGGPFPLIVFGHGFAVTPAAYYRLLRAFAQAGYVVAAPVFPREQAHALGGPDESDLINQPRDISVVISGMLRTTADRHARLSGMIDPGEIAVTGQSDGGETALAVAYDRFYRDTRVRAAAIFSGAQIPGAGVLLPGPPLLAVQGTADTLNRPINTDLFFAAAHRPKYLVHLFGARHLPPYTHEEPQLSIVERVTIAFLDRYLKRARNGLSRIHRAAERPGVAGLVARP
ncbi:MAG: alpha/beta hydrolase family protein [Solirubrobacteraceae bacterium]